MDKAIARAMVWLIVAGAVLLLGSSVGSIDLDSLLIKSVGGEAAVEKLSAVSSMYAAGSATLNEMPGTFELYLAVPGQIYFEMEFGSFSVAQGYDGNLAWQQDHNGMVSELSGYEKRSLLNQAYFQSYSFLFDDRLPGDREYLGLEERNGETFHKVAFYPLLEDTVFSYFDLQTGHQQYDVVFVDNLEVETEYLDHRGHQGVTVAFMSRATAPAVQLSAEIEVDTLAFNVEVEPSRFLRPMSEVDYRFPDGAESVIVPFEFVAGHIYLQAGVNGRQFTFILDSGASANIFHRPALAGLELPVVGNVHAVGVAGYEEVDLVQTDSVVIGDLVLLSQVGGSLDLTKIGRNWKGKAPFGGVLGFDFLSRFPVLVDYAASQLTVYDPDQFEPPVGGQQVGFEYTMQIPTIEAELVGIPGRYIVDLGNTFGLIVHKDYSRKHNLQNRLDSVEDIPQRISGVGGGVRGQTAHAATFSFGDIRVSDLRVMLPDSAGGLSGSVELAGNIGNLLLKQFRVLFDYASQRLVFYEIAETGD